MQTNFISKLAQLALVITALFITTSCISNTDNSYPSSVQIGVEVENMDSTLTYSDDSTIEVERVGIVLGESSFSTADSSLKMIAESFQLALDATRSNFQNPVGLGGRNVPGAGVYRSYTLTIPRAEENNNELNFDFVDGDTKYSMIFEGTYNDSSFTYKSEREIERTFSFTPVDVPAEDAQFLFLMSMDIKELFFGPSGALDPRDDSNSSQIDDNIEASLRFAEYDPQNQ